MSSDEEQIRDVVSTWMTATKAGDAATVLSLISDDAVFLVAGRPPMTKADFAAAARAQWQGPAPQFDGANDIQEINVVGDWAFMRSELTVVTTPPGGGPATTHAGHSLTIFRKDNGRRRLARDANMLALVQ